MVIADTRHRKAPYAPISALHEFLARIRNVGAPTVVDRKFIQKLNVASNNEWALLSALKFLGVIDERGEPTSSYRQLQTSDRLADTLRHLVETAYADLLDFGGLAMTAEELENYFRRTSSPSQAKNAARFFREVARVAGLTASEDRPAAEVPGSRAVPLLEDDVPTMHLIEDDDTRRMVLRAKARLLEKLPEPRSDWSATQYEAICRSFLDMLNHLDGVEA